MFIHLLDKKQQATLLALAHKMAQADEVLAPEEKARIQAIQDQMPGIEPLEMTLSDIATIFTTKQAKVAMLIELTGVAMADETIADEENTLLLEVAKSLAIEANELDEIISWVSRQCRQILIYLLWSSLMKPRRRL